MIFSESIRKLIRRGAIVIALVAGVPAFLTACALWANNSQVETVSQERLQQSYERSVKWIGSHRFEVLGDQNPMLWWMLKRSAELRDDPVLLELFAAYQSRYVDRNPGNPWRHVFGTDARPVIRFWEIERLPDYNLFILYGASCSEELAGAKIVRQQFSPDFCAPLASIGYLRYPSCLTHQLMGVHFLETSRCEPDQTRILKDKLKGKLLDQMYWDFRTTDVYLQRILMLSLMGAPGNINPSWIDSMLDAQNADGGWADFQLVAPLGGDRGLGFHGRGVGFSTTRSNFHTTIQGTLATALLLANQE